MKFERMKISPFEDRWVPDDDEEDAVETTRVGLVCVVIFVMFSEIKNQLQAETLLTWSLRILAILDIHFGWLRTFLRLVASHSFCDDKKKGKKKHWIESVANELQKKAASEEQSNLKAKDREKKTYFATLPCVLSSHHHQRLLLHLWSQ